MGKLMRNELLGISKFLIKPIFVSPNLLLKKPISTEYWLIKYEVNINGFVGTMASPVAIMIEWWQYVLSSLGEYLKTEVVRHDRPHSAFYAIG